MFLLLLLLFYSSIEKANNKLQRYWARDFPFTRAPSLTEFYIPPSPRIATRLLRDDRTAFSDIRAYRIPKDVVPRSGRS